MKSFRSILTIGILLMIPCLSNAQADGTNGLTVKGIITHEGQSLENAEIRVYNGRNRIVKEKRSRADGSFRIRLALDGYYVIEFRKSGMVSKRLLFRTHTPVHDQVYHPFDVEIVLFDKEDLKKHPDVDLDLPLGIVEYFPEKKDFHYVEGYTGKRLKEQKSILSETP